MTMVKDRLLELLPHYVAMLLLMLVVIGTLRTTVGEQGIWIELVIVVVLVLGYQLAVVKLGVAPSTWERR